MTRDAHLHRLDEANGSAWDLIIVGGGATGLGTAIDAAARGYRTLLLEQHDFAKGTSSRSTKLIHGGVRYLQQGNVSLVLEALRERGRLLRNAPHLVHHLPFVVPNYDWWEGPFYGIGLRLYDLLAGREGFGKSRNLSREETLDFLPNIEREGLRGGVLYYDGQFDDARLAITLARTAVDLGATVLNYVRVEGLLKDGGAVAGVEARDMETGRRYTLRARVVVNATGIFADALRRLDDPTAPSMMRPSQGVHLVLDRRFLPGDTAIMVPHTDDGRVLFAIPWHDRVVLGTTDTALDEPVLEPRALPGEIDFLLTHAARYLEEDPGREDVLSVFAGIRPLVGAEGTGDTASLSRDHTLHLSRSGLLTITGGKWTTYRKMAEDTIDQAALVGGLEERPCPTATLALHGAGAVDRSDAPAAYGTDAAAVEDVMHERPGWDAPVHPRLPLRRGEVIWACRHEMARTVEDVLARRSRSLLLDARASMEAAPEVARLMAEALGRDDAWIRDELRAYRTLAAGYVLA